MELLPASCKWQPNPEWENFSPSTNNLDATCYMHIVGSIISLASGLPVDDEGGYDAAAALAAAGLLSYDVLLEEPVIPPTEADIDAAWEKIELPDPPPLTDAERESLGLTST